MGDNQKGHKIIKIKHIFANGEVREKADGIKVPASVEIAELLIKMLKEA